MSKARQLADLGNVYDDGALSNRNILINGSFAIWQRGNYTTATAASHNTYYPDRWKIESGLSQTIQDTDRSAKVAVTSGGTNIVGLRQKVEDKNWVIALGKQVTFSAKVTSNSANARLCIYADGWSVGSAHSGNGTEETLTLTVTVPSSLTYGLIAEVSICGANYSNVAMSTGDYIDFTEAQLEVGDTATPFEHRSYGDELARCQRYYAEAGIVLSDTTPARYYNRIDLPVDMRAKPTISVGGYDLGTGGTVYYQIDSSGASNSKRSFYQNSSHSAISSAWFKFDAEL